MLTTIGEEENRQHSCGEVLDVVQIPTVGSRGEQSGNGNSVPQDRWGAPDTTETNVKSTWALGDTQTRKGKARWVLTKENEVVQVPAVGPSGRQLGVPPQAPSPGTSR